MPLQPRISNDAISSFYARYLAGESAKALGAEVGLTPQGVVDTFMRAGLERRSRARITQQELRDLYVRYMAGESITTLSLSAGYGERGLGAAFRRNGLALHHPGKRPMTLDHPRAQKAMALWDEGKTCREINAELGLNDRVTLRLVRESGRDSRKRGPGHYNWRGGRSVDFHGYVRVRIPADDPMAAMRNSRGEVKEHRLVMARTLGRPLGPDETVHHKNGDKHDNRPENLQLRSGNHGTGAVLVCCACGSHDIRTERL